MLGLNPLWQLHIDIHLNWSLWISKNKVHLLKGPAEMIPKMIISLIANHVTTGVYVSK